MVVVEDLYLRYFEFQQNSIIIVNHLGTIIYINPAFESLTGSVKAEVVGDSIGNLNVDDEFKQVFYNNQQRLRSGNVSKEVVIRPGKSGRLRYFEIEVMVLDNSDDEYMIGTIKEITHTIDKSRQVLFVEAELLRATTTLEQLLYKSSHDLRAPVSTIKGLMELAKKCEAGDELSNYFDLVNDNCAKLESLLIDLRKVYTIYMGRFSYGRVNFEELLNQTKRGLRRHGIVANVDFSCDIDLSRPYFGYKYLLERIIRNLMDNAFRYKKKGRKHKVELLVTNVDNYLKIRIRDNGHGVPEQISDKVFEMFYKGESGPKANGMGLFIVKSAVDKLNGTVDLSSDYGEGTTVTVMLPESSFQTPIF